MAIDATLAGNRAVRPSLRVVGGRGMTPAARNDESRMEEEVRRSEAHRHVAHLRLLAMQLPLFDAETAQRLLRRVATGYERKWSDETPGEAA